MEVLSRTTDLLLKDTPLTPNDPMAYLTTIHLRQHGMLCCHFLPPGSLHVLVASVSLLWIHIPFKVI